MALDIGTTLGTFEITGLLGKGGMGEVYRARDTKLGREVAIKVLGDVIAGDPDYLRRFETEAKVLASVDHPNVGAIYEFRHENDLHFLVMQLVEGETLADRIGRGRLSIREALPIFVQIARGLDAAHDKGIVHRDLKPANVKISPRGEVKVLDFGIATDTGKSSKVDPDAPTTPMMGIPVTGQGLIIGTPQYMSPEQARGKAVDRRTDVWALGCCVYEALSGIMPFTGDTVTDIVTAITRDDPEWAKLPDNIPRELERLLKRCLEKDLHRRSSSMADIAFALEDLETDIREGRATTVRDAAAEPPAELTPIRSLVVLPFENLMGDSDQNYLVDGMTEALTAELSKISALKVISRGSAMRYRKTDKAMPEIAQELGVEGLIEGSIVRAGDDIRITAQLIDGRTDVHVWSESFPGTMDNLLPMQGDVALEIAKAIHVVVTPEEKKQLKRRQPISRDVQRLLWEANYAFNSQSPQGYRDATRLYEQAVDKDPECVVAYVGLVAAYWVPSILGLSRPSEVLKKADAAAVRALELEPDSAEAQFTAGYIAMTYRHDWEGAKKHFDRAIELNPNSAEAHSGLGLWYVATAQFDEAVHEETLARELDPASPMHANNLGVAYLCLENYEESEKNFSDAVELSPQFLLGHMNRLSMRVWFDHSERNVKAIEELAEQTGRLAPVLGVLAWARASIGDMPGAKALSKEIEAAAEQGYVPPNSRGLANMAIGNYDNGAKYLHDSIDEREWNALYIPTCPWFGGFVYDDPPGLDDLMDHLNFPDDAKRRAHRYRENLRYGPKLEAKPGESKTSSPALRYAGAAIVAMLLVLGGFFAGRGGGTPAGDPTGTVETEPLLTSLAVLPLHNLMEDPEQEYFVDGMTEALTAELAKINALKVISRTTTMRYKDSDKSALEIAQELGVEGLIEGSVMRVDDEVRITVQLIDARNDRHLWAETYDNTLENVFKLHSDVALAIAREVRATVTPQEAARLADVPEVDPEALDAYLRGMDLAWSESNILGAMGYLGRATEIDPDFGRAWSRKGYLHFTMSLIAPSSFDEQTRLADESAARAIDAAPEDGEAYHARIFHDMVVKHDWESAKSTLVHALALSPNSPLLNQLAGSLYLMLGDQRSAKSHIERAIEIDRDALFTTPVASYTLAAAGDPHRAREVIDRYVERNPEVFSGLFFRTLVLAFTDDRQAHIDSARESMLMSGPTMQLALADALVRTEATRKEGRALAEGYFESNSVTDVLPVYGAMYYLAARETDKALDWLEIGAGVPNILYLITLRASPWSSPAMEEHFAGLLENDRYWRLIDKFNIPPFPPDHPGYEAEQAWFARRDSVSGNTGIEKIAVLPFANLSGDPEQEYFVDGMTEALTMELARVKSMSVLSRTSAMQFKGVLKPMHEIASELGVDALVEGSVMRAGDQVRITAQLIDGSTDEHLWADRYDGTMDDILNLQSQVALAIAGEVTTAITPEETAELTAPRSISPDAYEAYLRGLQVWNRRDLAESVPHFERAIELAPDYAPAYAGLANAYVLLASFALIEPEAGFEKARINAERALELDPDSPPAQVALAWKLAWHDWKWRESEAMFTRIQQEHPDYTPAYYWHGINLAITQRLDEAFEKLERAMELDPIAVPVTRLRTLMLGMSGQDEEAIAVGLRHLEASPEDHQVVSAVVNSYARLGRVDEARALLVEQNFDPRLANTGFVPYKALGLVEQGEAVLRELREKSQREYVPQTTIIATLIGLGRLEEATEATLAEWEKGNRRVGIIALNPVYREFNGDPRFDVIREQLLSDE